MAQLRCPQGHQWSPDPSSTAPPVCPTCGRNAATAPPPDAEQTLDDECTLALPASAVPSRDEVTTTLHFTPAPAAPSSQSSQISNAGRSYGGQSTAGRGGGSSAISHPRIPTGMPFVIIRQHARGGLGVVSLARDDAIKREVALKQVLPQHLDNAILKRRFLYEAQITGQLEHPSIVPVYTLGADETGNPYYVMRFLKGRTLDEIIKEHHLSPNPIVFRELLRRFIAVCQAVAYAHSRGVIHRDLKPANIMLGDYGETLVLDWGLAKDIKQVGNDPALWGETSNHGTPSPSSAGSSAGGGGGSSAGNAAELTMQGQIIGTPAYMAPEQAEGRTELHGPVTDNYALGGILYKILTGQSPQAPQASTTGSNGGRKLTFVPSPPPSKVAKEPIDPILDAICARAMATDPAARYPRALEMAQDIQRWLDEHPLAIRPRTASARLARKLREHAVPIILALVTIIALLAVLLVSTRRA